MLTALAVPLAAQQVESDVFDELHYRYIGPEGNRISAVEGVPGTAPAAERSGVIQLSHIAGARLDGILDGIVAGGIGLAARAVLARNGVETEVIYPACCGMPQQAG